MDSRKWQMSIIESNNDGWRYKHKREPCNHRRAVRNVCCCHNDYECDHHFLFLVLVVVDLCSFTFCFRCAVLGWSFWVRIPLSIARTVSKTPTAGSISIHFPRPNSFCLFSPLFLPDPTQRLAVHPIDWCQNTTAADIRHHSGFTIL